MRNTSTGASTLTAPVAGSRAPPASTLAGTSTLRGTAAASAQSAGVRTVNFMVEDSVYGGKHKGLLFEAAQQNLIKE